MTKTIKKKPHTSAYKFRVAMAALKGDKTVSQLCQEFGVVASQIYKWKTALLERGSSVFEQGVSGTHLPENELDKLHAAIGASKLRMILLGRSR